MICNRLTQMVDEMEGVIGNIVAKIDMICNRLTQKVDEMEGVIGNIVAKIDMVLIKLEGIELSKEKRKETMFKIFEGITKEETGIVLFSI